MTPTEIRERAEVDLLFFINLVDPFDICGACHREMVAFWENPNAKSHQLVLFPRDHKKSRMIAFRCAQRCLRDPLVRILYISATSDLAEKQLGFIKNILSSDVVRRYWPEHVNVEEGRRRKWTNSEIELDHPLRKLHNIREPTIFTAGLTTTITGKHCDVAVLDDLVVHENAYTAEGRARVRSQYSLLSSIEGAEGEEWGVGTRYFPRDLYYDMQMMKEEIYDDTGNKVSEDPIYEVMERTVENFGDGTGDYLWPRQQRADGKWFGFDQKILARKRGQYLDRAQFRAQYYNNPDDPDNRPLSYENFLYYDDARLRERSGAWFYGNQKLNLTVSIDFAYSIKVKADFTCIAVVGTDCYNNQFVLDIDRFKTGDISEYFTHLLHMYNKWKFRRLIAESNAAQMAIVKTLKTEYILKNGLPIDVIEINHTRHGGTKEERVTATLLPLYKEGKVYHHRSGTIQVLEEELVSSRPAHDDAKDALALAIGHCIAPAKVRERKQESATQFHPRFGGRSR